jgi:hypothetical protein
METAHAAQSVEGYDQRQTESFLQLCAHECGHEEMSMNEIVAGAASVPQGMLGEFIHERKQLLLGASLGWAGRDMNHAHAVEPFQDRRQVGVVAAGEDFDAMAAPRQMPRHLSDIDVLAAAVHTSQPRQRRGVFANHGDA